MKVLVCLKKAIVAAAIILLFSSCENFLASGNIKENIKNKIDYNEAKTVQVNLECDHEMGTIYPEGYYSAKLGFAFEIQFVPNTEKYVIKNKSEMLEAVSRLYEESRTGYVEFTYLDQTNEDKKQGLYRINAKIVKAADDLKIQPLVTERPKVIDVYPPYNPSGVNQDTTIRLTFNKAIDSASFGNFSCLKILNSDGQDITSYYQTPYLTNDNTILNIPKTPESIIVPYDSETGFEDIFLSIDFSNVKDSEGIYLVQNNSYSFRFNKNVDRVKPVLTSVSLKTTSDTSSLYYRTLTNKAFSEWSNSPTEQNLFGDFSQNHVSNTIYLEASGYDKDSGVNGIQIVETFYKTVDAHDTSLPYATGVCGINKFVYTFTDSNNNNIYSLSDKYSFVSIYEGVIKLDVSVIDNAGNASEPTTYYVIKDNSIESTSINFLETSAYSKYAPRMTNYVDIFDHVRINENGLDTVVLTLTDDSIDTFYADYYSKYDIEVFYGDSQESVNARASEVNGSFSFTRNPRFITFIKVICTDSVGNILEFLRALPPSPVISKFEKGSVEVGYESGYYSDYVKIIPEYQNEYSNMCESLGADTFGVFYVVRNTVYENSNYSVSDSAFEDQIIDNNGQNDGIWDSPYKEYHFYFVTYYKYGNAFWYSVLSDKYIIANVRHEDGCKQINGPLTISSTDDETEPVFDQSFNTFMKDEIQVTVEPWLNSEACKITLDDYKKHGIDTSDIIYTFECVDITDSENKITYIFTEPTFYLKSMAKYKLHIRARKGDEYYRSQWCWCYINGADTYTNDYSFFLKDDLSPPRFDSQRHIFIVSDYSLYSSFEPGEIDNPNWADTASYWVMSSLPKDNPESAPAGTTISGMYEIPEKPGYGMIDYYFIPNSNTTVDLYSLYTLQNLEAYEKNTLVYKLDDTCLRIPYGHLEEGLYTICLVAKDNFGNYSIKCAPAFNRTLGTKISTTIEATGSDTNGYYKIISENTDFNVDFYNTVSKEWESACKRTVRAEDEFMPDWHEGAWEWSFDRKGGPKYNGWLKIHGTKCEYVDAENWDYSYDFNVSNCGFYLVDYICTWYEKAKANGNPLTCTKKSIIQLSDKYKILCDNSVFVHTMYCRKKLTETTTDYDLTLWETKAEETGIFVHGRPADIEPNQEGYDENYYENHSDVYYTFDNYDDIPDGYYYTTIFHFADGYAYMTDIKQK